jgi:hypothetical protein
MKAYAPREITSNSEAFEIILKVYLKDIFQRDYNCNRYCRFRVSQRE